MESLLILPESFLFAKNNKIIVYFIFVSNLKSLWRVKSVDRKWNRNNVSFDLFDYKIRSRLVWQRPMMRRTPINVVHLFVSLPRKRIRLLRCDDWNIGHEPITAWKVCAHTVSMCIRCFKYYITLVLTVAAAWREQCWIVQSLKTREFCFELSYDWIVTVMITMWIYSFFNIGNRLLLFFARL